jgi:hypothetical protein
METSRKSRIPIGAVGGALALAASLAGATTEAMGNTPASDLGGFTLILVFFAGLIAVVRPRRVEALAVADVLLAISLTIEMFSRLGALYVPVLLVLLLGTMRAHATEELEEEVVAEPVARPARPMLAAEYERQRRVRAELLRGLGSAESLRRAG